MRECNLYQTICLISYLVFLTSVKVWKLD